MIQDYYNYEKSTLAVEALTQQITITQSCAIRRAYNYLLNTCT